MIGVYFSGTGNTRYCVEKFLGCFGTYPAVSIESSGVSNAVKEHTEIIFAYPIYFSCLPKIVNDFMRQHRDIFRNKKIFIIATMGLFSGDGAGCAGRYFQKSGAELLGGLHIKMPDSIADEKALKRPLEKNRLLIKHADLKIKEAAEKYKNGTPPREGLHFLDHMAGLLGQRLWFYGKTRKYSNRLRVDAARCRGCGGCIPLCPMQNLHLVYTKAVSKGMCTMCYRCVNHCPRQAITLLGRKIICQGTIDTYIS